jgi:hypothetical protein
MKGELMNREDKWGRDPSVQVMRRIFKHMEMNQEALLRSSNISPFDTRLRHWREKALESFEKSWEYAAKYGFELNEESAAVLYSHCLVRAIIEEGAGPAVEMLPKDEKIEMLLREALS